MPSVMAIPPISATDQIVSLDGAEGKTKPYHISKAAKYILGKARFEKGRIRYASDSDLSERDPALPCDPEFRQILWLGFVSNGVAPAVMYLDNIVMMKVQ